MNESSLNGNLNLLNDFYVFLCKNWDTQSENFWQFFMSNGIWEIIFVLIEMFSGLKSENESLVGMILKSTDENVWDSLDVFWMQHKRRCQDQGKDQRDACDGGVIPEKKIPTR